MLLLDMYGRPSVAAPLQKNKLDGRTRGGHRGPPLAATQTADLAVLLPSAAESLVKLDQG